MKKKQVIYISGQISGIPHEEAVARFRRAELALRLSFPHAKIINPMKNPFPRGTKWQWYMLYGLFRLSRSTHIFMMSRWQISDGARIEYRWAKHIGLEFLFGVRK